jgi:hypothetical protein
MSTEDPWAEHAAAMEEGKTVIVELEKAERSLADEIAAATAEGAMEHEDLSEALEELDGVREVLSEARNKLRSMELAYVQHASYEAAHAPATISAEPEVDGDDTGGHDKPEE